MADSAARGLALAALGQYNALIKVTGWTITGTEQIAGPFGEYVQLKVNYKYIDGEGQERTSYFTVNHGKGIHSYTLDITKGDIDPTDPTKHLGYDSNNIYYLITYIDGTTQELTQPVIRFSLKKIVVTSLPSASTAEGGAIYYHQQEDGSYKLYIRNYITSGGTTTYDWTTIPTKTSQLTNDSGFITISDVPQEVYRVTFTGRPETITTTDTISNIITQATTKKVIAKFENTIFELAGASNQSGILFTCIINGMIGVIQGNVVGGVDTWEFYAITIPNKTSQLTNDSGFIDNTVNNLINYRTSAAQDIIDATKQSILTAGSAIDLNNNTLSVKYDGTTIILNANNQLEAVGGGGGGGTVVTTKYQLTIPSGGTYPTCLVIIPSGHSLVNHWAENSQGKRVWVDETFTYGTSNKVASITFEAPSATEELTAVVTTMH